MRTTCQWTYQILFVYCDLVAENIPGKYFYYFVRSKSVQRSSRCFIFNYDHSNTTI